MKGASTLSDESTKDVTEKFLEIAERDLGPIRLVFDGNPALDDALVSRRLPDGRHLVVDATPEDALDKSTRLDLLLDCFIGTLEASAPTTLPEVRDLPSGYVLAAHGRRVLDQGAGCESRTTDWTRARR